MRPKTLSLNTFIFLCLALSAQLTSAEEATKDIDTVVDVSIIGNSELPNVSFNLPWRLPSVENREEQSPKPNVEHIFQGLEPERHRKLVHFSRYLEVDLPEFRGR